MTVKITAANGGSDSLDFGCAQTAIVATVTGTEVSSGEGKLELKTTTGGTSTARLTIDPNGRVQIDGEMTDDFLVIKTTEAGAGSAPDVVLYRSSSSPADSDSLGKVVFRGRNDNSQDVEYAQVIAQAIDVSDGTEDGKLYLQTIHAGSHVNNIILDATGCAITGDLKFNSGYGSAVTAYGCRAWVNFNGSGTVSINDHGNVSSITDNGTGDYTVNFAVAMPDANFAVAGLSKSADTGGIRGAFMSLVANSTATATGYVRVTTQYDNTNVRDSNPVTVAIFR